MKIHKYINLSPFLIALIISCSKEKNPVVPEPVLSHEYMGVFKLNYTNEFPAIDKIAQVDVTVNKQGEMIFSKTTVSYDADDHNGQTRIKRVGTLNLQPKGNYFHHNGNDKFNVNENTTINETMTIWYGDGVDWILYTTQDIQGTWNGGLVFDLSDAVMNGSHVTVNTGYFSATWTLLLIPKPQI